MIHIAVTDRLIPLAADRVPGRGRHPFYGAIKPLLSYNKFSNQALTYFSQNAIVTI
jgi:hypothetical protein